MQDLQRQEVQDLIDKGAQVVETLPPNEYEGAVSRRVVEMRV